jgi:phage terminase large subunit
MEIVLHPKQSRLMRDTHRYKVIRCGRRFGKTYFSVTKITMEAMMKKGDYWFVAPTYRMAKEIVWRLFEEIVPKGAVDKRNETELSIELKNGSKISLKGAEDPEKLRGVGLDGVVLDEFAFMSPQAWTVISPTLQDRKGWAIFISTPNGYNHFYDLYNTIDDDFQSFHFTSYDNPYLEADELDKERARMSSEKFEQEYMAEFMKRSGAIWPQFDRDVHVVDRREPKGTIFGSIDFGFAVGHETAVLWHEVTSEGVYTFDGFDVAQKSIDEVDEMMKSQTNGLIIQGIFADPARPDLIDELKRKDWPVLETNKDVELGIAKVHEYMMYDPVNKKPKWTISRHLTGAIEQIEQYVWTEVRGEDGKFKQVPKKENDNYPDSLRYFIFNYLNQEQTETFIPPVELLGGIGKTKGQYV